MDTLEMTESISTDVLVQLTFGDISTELEKTDHNPTYRESINFVPDLHRNVLASIKTDGLSRIRLVDY